MYETVQMLILHPENPIPVLLDYAIAVAGSRRQTIMIKDHHMPSQDPDETGCLKRARRHRHARSADAQHH